jgi:processive 1,2-diacylglycerol beta-glucosyltransferase
MTPISPFSLAIYSADAWEHACMVVRILSPAERAGWKLIQGAEWINGALCVFPERVAQADLVIITRDFPARSSDYRRVMDAARSHGKTVVYETDDLLLELPEQHPDYERYLAARAAMLQAVVEADAVVGSTSGLCDYLRTFNAHTWLWENYLDEKLWQPEQIPPRVPAPDDRPVCLGYMGGQSHAADLETILPALQQILDQYPSRVQIKFWGLEPPRGLCKHPGVEWDPVRLVDYRSFAAYFSGQKCDIFIAPLQDNLFNRCKSHLKFLEYSALAVPGVYSRVAPYQGMVIYGTNGFLADQPQEWVDCLSRLIEDPALRARMGGEAQATLRSQWLLADHAGQFAELYQGFALGASSTDRGAGSLRVQPEASLAAQHIAQKMGAFYQDLVRKREDELRARMKNDVLQAQVAEKERAFLELDRTAQGYYALYREVMDSRSWHWMQRLIGWRLHLVPKGSRSEQVLRTVYRSAAALKSGGLRASLQTALQGARTILQPAPVQAPPQAPQAAVQLPQQLPAVVFNGTLPGRAGCRLPAVRIIVIEGENSPASDPPDIDSLLRWLRGQTLPGAAQVVVWDKTAGQARLLDNPAASWKAADVAALLDDQAGRARPGQPAYICLASPDLLSQPATYLETNLCALQAEALAFTVNLQGAPPWAIQRAEAGWLPGNHSLPLLRQVVRRECVGQNFSLDLRPWLERRDELLPPGRQEMGSEFTVAGRIITVTTGLADTQHGLPFERKSVQAFTLLDRHFVSGIPAVPKSHFESESSPFAQVLLPLDQVMPHAPELCDLPTVFLVMPFLAVGGAEKIALKVIQNLAGQVRFVVLAFDELDAQLGTMADAFRQATPYVYILPDFTHNRLNASLLDYLIARFDPCTIYIANGTPWIYDALGEIKRRYPHLRLVNQVYDHQVGWINRYDPALVLYLDAHIGSNPRICQAYHEKGARLDQVHFIENGSDSQELDPGKYDDEQVLQLKARLGLPAQAGVVTFASRLHPQKRPLDFIELARRFSSDPGVAFLMAGDGSLAAQVDEQIHKIGLHNIRRIPFYQPVSDLLAVTDVLVLPSEYEGMSMIVLEAQTMGRPVVVTDVGNNREIIERTAGGVVLSQIGDVSALMHAVRQMLDHPPDRAALRRNTLAHFDWKVVAQKYRAVLSGDSDG